MKFFLNIFILLVSIGNCLQAKTLSRMIIESEYCIVGKIISVDSTTYLVKVDSSLHSKLSFDTILVFKTGVSRYSKIKEYAVENQFILILTKPYSFKGNDIYFEDGAFQIINDSVNYENFTSKSFNFIESIQLYYKLYDSFCSTYQNGEESSKEIEVFKKASEINKKLIGETYEYCYSDNSKVNNSIPVISATKTSILYVGPENQVCIAVPKYKSDDFYATITNGELLKNGECYKVKVYKTGKKQICVYDKKTKKMFRLFRI